jgi:phosphoribosylformylglycinamidine synthase subunit PurQ / glutaminase
VGNKRLKFGIIVFPGTNCEYDCQYVLENLLDIKGTFIWHQEKALEGFDALVIPGGFSYGDYLRSGAIASFSPIMQSVMDFASHGGKIIGICNGFQILLEQGLLPGALLRNNNLKFICRYVYLRIDDNNTFFTRNYDKGQVIRLPIRHNDGNYYIDDKGYSELLENGQIILRYSDPSGDVSHKSNPNGSVGNVAGICNKDRNVFGLMPHPEVSCEEILGSLDGLGIFKSMIESL